MADLTITAASVVAGANASITRGTAGASVTAGQVVYLDEASTGKWLLADNDAATAAARGNGKIGIALHAAAANQPLSVQTAGTITIGATMTAGVDYYLSATAGGICPYADIGSADYVTRVGMATSTTVLTLDFLYSGVSL